MKWLIGWNAALTVALVVILIFGFLWHGVLTTGLPDIEDVINENRDALLATAELLDEVINELNEGIIDNRGYVQENRKEIIALSDKFNELIDIVNKMPPVLKN